MFLIVNFGGPRHLQEIPIFLKTLLTDEDVIRPTLFHPLHNLLFTYIARKRAKTLIKDYEDIGGKSPIFEETEELACTLEKKMQAPFFTFHRYLPETHRKTLSIIEQTSHEKIYVIPMFPQFSYATTGSCARFFQKRLSPRNLNKLCWIKSYASHPSFICMWQNALSKFLANVGISQEEAFFLFSAHGLPQSFIDEGDPYEKECRCTVEKVMQSLPDVPFILSFQSQFGKEKWNEPYTKKICQEIGRWNQGRKHIFFVPISFTSDHIETLFEIEKLYMPLVRSQGLNVYRVPACYAYKDFSESICVLLKNASFVSTSMLIRPK